MAKASNSASRRRFDPLAMPPNMGAFNQEVSADAKAQYQPQLSDLGRQQNVETRRHTGRLGDIGTDYKAYGNELAGAFADTRDALTNLATLHHGSDEAAARTLGAALSTGHEADAARTNTIMGGDTAGAPVDQTPDQAAILEAAIGGSGDAALTNRFGADIAKSGADRSLAGLGQVRAGETEANRFAGALNDLTDRRAAITTNIPNIISTTRRGLLQDYRSAQNQGFTQNLATRQFNLQANNQKFNQNLQTQQFSLQTAQFHWHQFVDKANINLNKGKLAQGWATIKLSAQQGKGSKGNQKATARAKSFIAGGNFLDGYTTPPKGFYIGAPPQIAVGSRTDNAGNKHTIFGPDPNARPYHPNPGSAFNSLRSRFGLSTNDALRLMDSVNIKSFQDFVWNKRHRSSLGPNGIVAGP